MCHLHAYSVVSFIISSSASSSLRFVASFASPLLHTVTDAVATISIVVVADCVVAGGACVVGISVVGS